MIRSVVLAQDESSDTYPSEAPPVERGSEAHSLYPLATSLTKGLVLRDYGENRASSYMKRDPWSPRTASRADGCCLRSCVPGLGSSWKKPKALKHLPNMRDDVPDSREAPDLFPQPLGHQAGLFVHVDCHQPILLAGTILKLPGFGSSRSSLQIACVLTVSTHCLIHRGVMPKISGYCCRLSATQLRSTSP